MKSESKIATQQLVKARYLGEDKKDHSLKDIFNYHNEKMGVKLAPKTLYHYKASQKYILIRYQMSIKKMIYFFKIWTINLFWD
ncbi:hypothetical protein [Maribacter aurantiacus]|nr:hypothetical protein [Maribacter aurantiacus]